MKATISYRILIGIKNFAERNRIRKLAAWADIQSRKIFWTVC